MEPVAPSLELITRVRATLAEPLELGQTPRGRRRVIGITGGEFDGPLMSGRVLPGGADWQIVHEDGSATIDTRYTLETDDGGLVYVATRGCRTGPREVLGRIAAGETVDPSEYYFRVSIQYETSAPGYEWLNWVVAVASALRLADQVEYDAYAVR
jgi:5-methylphenazine-1-carboxylate 1-monooxygenase